MSQSDFYLSDPRGLTRSPSLGLILWLGEMIYGGPGDGVKVRDEPDDGDKGRLSATVRMNGPKSSSLSCPWPLPCNLAVACPMGELNSIPDTRSNP